MGDCAAEYNKQAMEVWNHRPERCPGCAAAQAQIIGHGWYPRWAIYIAFDVALVGIKRWRCKGCGKTISLLPSFLHHYRHYALSVIEDVLQRRCEQDIPVKACVRGPVPSERSVRRWEAVFVAQALRWLSAVLTWLARVMPTLLALDPHGEQPGPASQQLARQLLARIRDLAAWLAPGHSGALRVVWRWGWNAGVGRLV